MKARLFLGSIFVLASISIITANAQIGRRQVTRSIIGTVIDQQTGVRLADVNIIMNQKRQTATDEVGKFIIRNISSGNNIITVKSTGYYEVRKTVNIRKDVTRVLIRLKPKTVDDKS